MKIQTITSEHNNDFSAVLECEHCRETQKITTGYHDNYYHTMVIPSMVCRNQKCRRNRSGLQMEMEASK